MSRFGEWSRERERESIHGAVTIGSWQLKGEKAKTNAEKEAVVVDAVAVVASCN